MSAKVSIDDQLLKQLRQTGEMQVEDSHGVPLVLMTVHARQQLHKVVDKGDCKLDDSEWTEEEMRAMGKEQLKDSEGWGAPGMDAYDTMEGIDDNSNGHS